MKIIFRDGYIQTNINGNTYAGNVAHQFMHSANKFARENNCDFKEILNIYIKEYKNMVKEEIKNRKSISFN